MRKQQIFLGSTLHYGPAKLVYETIPTFNGFLILGGMGLVTLSTSRGTMIDREARLEGIYGFGKVLTLQKNWQHQQT